MPGLSYLKKEEKLKRKGFTLIELMVVMAIIAVLATLIIGAVTVARNTSKDTVHRGNARTLQAGLEAYFAKNRSYPATSGSVAFTAAATSVSVTLGATSECTVSTQLGGGIVTYTTGGYSITPYDSACTASLGAGDVLSNN